MIEFEPTNAVPGSEEKLAVMAERRRNEFPLFHPLDNNWVSEPKERDYRKRVKGLKPPLKKDMSGIDEGSDSFDDDNPD